MKISLKFLEICSKHVFVWVWRFFSGYVLIVLSFWSCRKNEFGKKVLTWCNDFAFHVGYHVSICRMPTWVRKTVSTKQKCKRWKMLVEWNHANWLDFFVLRASNNQSCCLLIEGFCLEGLTVWKEEWHFV